MRTQLRYRPFRALRGKDVAPDRRVAAIATLIEAGSYEEAIEESAALIKLTLEGLRYLQTYDWLFLRALITVGYLGWMAYALATVLDLHVLQGTTGPARTPLGTVVSSSVLAVLYATFLISHSPLTYYAYAFFPVYFWDQAYVSRQTFGKGSRLLFGHIKSGGALLSFVLSGVIYVGIIVLLVQLPRSLRRRLGLLTREGHRVHPVHCGSLLAGNSGLRFPPEELAGCILLVYYMPRHEHFHVASGHEGGGCQPYVGAQAPEKTL